MEVSPDDLLIFYQLTKFKAPSYNLVFVMIS